VSIKWASVTASRVDNATVDNLAAIAVDGLRHSDTGVSFATTGDTLVIATRDEGGEVFVRECLLRREAVVS
jgi:hypothetical protein